MATDVSPQPLSPLRGSHVFYRGLSPGLDAPGFMLSAASGGSSHSLSLTSPGL
jgi:hypothetical protein